MKKNKLLGWTVLVLGVVNFPLIENAKAQNPNTGIALPASAPGDAGGNSDEEAFVEKPWYVFLGADAGFSSYGAYNSALEGTRSGFHGGFRGLLAHYSKKWVIDGGLGFHFISNSGTNPDATSSQTKVTTRGVYLDLSPRYRAGKNWQIGPELEYWASTDNGLNQNALDGTTTNHAIFGGAQVAYEWPSSQNKYRLGARYLKNFNLTQRSVNVIQAFFQIGFSVFDSSPDRDEEERPAPRHVEPEQVNDSDMRSQYVSPNDPLPLATPSEEASPTPWPEPEVMSTPAPEASPTPSEKPKAAKKLVLTLDVNDLPFEFDSAKLPKYNSDRVRDLGRFLAQHNKSWKKLVVGGHTDERGSKSYNQNLSQARADTVRKFLVEGGAPSARIVAKGFGETKPKDKHHSEKAYARNRRVELEFQGVKDVVLLKNALQRKEH